MIDPKSEKDKFYYPPPNYIINLNHYIPFNDIFYIDQTIQTNNNNIN